MKSEIPRRMRGALALASLAWGCQGAGADIPAPHELNLPPGEQLLDSGHGGPPVVSGASGPARYASILCEEFDGTYARELVELVDMFYRAPGNDGYEAALARLESDLRAAGFGSEPGLELFSLEVPLTAPAWAQPDDSRREPALAWTPISASLKLEGPGREPRVLHAFAAPGDRDRTMLPVNAPSADVEGAVALDLEDLAAGQFLVTSVRPARSILQRAAALGAVGVLSCYLDTYNRDPSGRQREREAIHYSVLPTGVPIPVAMISPRAYEAIEAAHLADPESSVRLEAAVKLDQRPLRTLVAVVRGLDRPQEAFAIASHLQEPGANDNATGVAGLAESARLLARLVREGRLERPSRSLVFLWGDEFRQSSSWLDSTEMRCVGGLSSDMTGASREETGAICLLERMPDPGALHALPPDEHTLWGQTQVEPEAIVPNGLAVIARCALVDVGQHQPGWETNEHPYEGGSDHDVFLERGLPCALIWHFTDFTYHTSLDRLEMVDYNELRRTAAAILATALCVADPRPADLDRYLRTLNKEQSTRVAAALEVGDEALAQQWREWCEGARQWLRVECLQIPESER